MKTKIVFLAFALIFGLKLQAQIDRSKQPEPGPAPNISLGIPDEFELRNGLKVLVVQNKKLPRVSYSLTIDNPPISEGDKKGVRGILGTMLGNGTTRISKDAFNEEVDFLGARLNFGANGGFASCLSKYSERVLELMADAVINPLLTQEEFQKEIDKSIDGLKTAEKSVSAISDRVTDALSYGAKHPYGEYITEETLKNITLYNIKAAYQDNYTPKRGYLVIVGDIDPVRIKKHVKKYFGKWKNNLDISRNVPQTAPNVQKTQINFVDAPNAVQSNIVLTNNVELKMGDDDYHAALIANYILGGGATGYLFQNLRDDKAYTYGAYSRISPSRFGASRFRATAEVRNEVTDSSVVEMLKEVKRLKTETVNAKTLNIAKAAYVGNFVKALERPQTIANYALNIKLNNLPKDFYTTYLKKINAVTAEDVKRVAAKYLNNDNMRVIVVGKGSDVIENLEKTNIPVKYFDKYANTIDKPVFELPLPEGVTANSVLNKYIETIGGQANLDKVNSVSITAEAELQPGMMMNLEMKKTSKNQMAQEVTAAGMSFMKTVVDGNAGYVVIQGKRKDMSPEEVQKTKTEASPFPEVNYLSQNVTLVKIENVDGQNAYKIKVNDEMSVYYSVETGLKIKEERATPAGASFLFYSDYKEVSGIKFPFKLAQTMGPQKFDFKVKEVKVNQGVSDSDFD